MYIYIGRGGAGTASRVRSGSESSYSSLFRALGVTQIRTASFGGFSGSNKPVRQPVEGSRRYTKPNPPKVGLQVSGSGFGF